MKLPLMLSLPFIVFGFDLNFSKEFTKSLTPNELTSDVRVVVESKDEKSVLSNLNKYNDFLKDYDDVEKSNVSMSVTPKYSYKDGTSTFIGYNGVLNYTVSSKKSKEVKKFLEEFYSLEKVEGVSLQMPTMRWQIDSKMYEKATSELKIDSIIWAKEYAKELSDEINEECEVEAINLGGNFTRPMNFRSEAIMYKSDSAMSVPIVENLEQDITIQANILLECK